MVCPYCGVEIPDNSRFCPECGAPLGEGLGESEGAEIEREIYSLLATANLYRIRGLWQEAENKCVEVLRRYPNNPTAHSLLGDIYADQGKWEEAKEWYELALELNPSSEVDRKKLERVKDILEQRDKQTKGKMVSWGAAAFALMAISFSLFLFFRWQKERANIPFYRPQVIANMPVSNPPFPIPLPQEENPPLPPIPFTPREENIRQRILEKKLPGVEGVKVTVDPLSQRVIIDIFSPLSLNSGDIQTWLVRTGFPILRISGEADGMINYFTLRLIVPIGSLADLAFQADITRDQLDRATAETILQLFQNVWWHPTLAPALPPQ